jgi:hypothetical protein
MHDFTACWLTYAGHRPKRESRRAIRNEKRTTPTTASSDKVSATPAPLAYVLYVVASNRSKRARNRSALVSKAIGTVSVRGCRPGRYDHTNERRKWVWAAANAVTRMTAVAGAGGALPRCGIL